MKERLRARLWLTVQKYDETYWYQPDPSDNWSAKTTHLEQTERKLERLLGWPKLRLKTRTTDEVVEIEKYFMNGYPSCALEVIEQFIEELAGYGDAGRESALRFQKDENDAMADFECPWRLSEEQFFLIDPIFFQEELTQKCEQVLREQGFKGAHDEYREAREELSDGKHKDAIVKAFKSFESALKTALQKPTGDVANLLKQFREAGLMDDIPEEPAKAICAKVFASLAVLRNELGGHGQGTEVVDVPRPYAVLALHLAGSLNQFVVQQYLQKLSTELPSASAGQA